MKTNQECVSTDLFSHLFFKKIQTPTFFAKGEFEKMVKDYLATDRRIENPVRQKNSLKPNPGIW